jgi:hypothetical protein
MTHFKPFFGIYYFLGIVLDVREKGNQLVASMPGVPDGFEVLLIPQGEGRFQCRGGPLDGSTLAFQRDKTGRVSGIQAGNFQLTKIDPHDLDELPVTQRLLAPEFELTPEKRDQFERLIQKYLSRPKGGWMDYDLPFPKHEFIRYLTDKDIVIFHGSNKLDIDVFKPVRKSMELRDETGRGNIAGVYGTHDGLWAMFFAVIDRQRLEGSIRNGVMYFQDRTGKQLAVYNFSINQDQLDEPPVADGALYLLPRDTFRRLKLTAESFANEWVSEVPVRPYIGLQIQPEDFPFLGDIGGHDDSELIRLGEISKEIRTTAVSADLEGDRIAIHLPPGAPVVDHLGEYIALQKIMTPAASFQLDQTGESVRLVIDSMPPAMVHMVSESYAALLD